MSEFVLKPYEQQQSKNERWLHDFTKGTVVRITYKNNSVRGKLKSVKTSGGHVC